MEAPSKQVSLTRMLQLMVVLSVLLAVVALAALVTIDRYKFKFIIVVAALASTSMLLLLCVFRQRLESALNSLVDKSTRAATHYVYPSQPILPWLTLTPILLTSVYLLYLALTNPLEYRLFISEDGPIESLSALIWLSAGVCLLIKVVLQLGELDTKTLVIPNLMLALFFLLCCGEEISWGQRLLDIEVPLFMKSMNVQQELTLHNIGSTSVFQNLFFVLCLSFFIVLPVACRQLPWLQSVISYLNVPVPNKHSSLVFVLALLVWGIIGVRFGTLGFHPFSFYPERYYPQMDDEAFELLAAYSFFVFSLLSPKRGFATVG